MREPSQPPLLLTPGPLTTSAATRAALGRDWGSREAPFVALTARLRDRLARLAGHGDSYPLVAIPLQGSGTFAVEAAIQSLVPRDGRLLVLVNGAYGRRMVEIGRRAGRDVAALTWPEDRPVDPAALDTSLAADPAITDIAVVQCETTSGLLNPLDAVAAVARRHGRRLLIDAMSGFGALPLDMAALGATAVMASSNKCLEGVPGLAFVVVTQAHLAACQGRANSLTLDLFDQAEGFARNGQWRFTPPVQVAAALDAALDQLDAEGGPAARLARYAANHAAVVAAMRRHGFETYLPDALQAPIITTFNLPGAWFRFDAFYEFLQARGIVIYPGKLTEAPSFRIGCIGAIGPADMARVEAAVAAFVTQARQVTT